MITPRLKNIFALSIPFFILHGIEEIWTGFYTTDPLDKFLFRSAESLSAHGAMFVGFQVMFWLLLIVSFLLLSGSQWQLRLLTVFGFVYIFELYHFFITAMVMSYTPGLITALVFPVLGYFYWRELLKARKN